MKTQDGFTVVEVLAALAICSIVASAAASATLFHLRANNRAEVKSEAIIATEQVLDELRVDDPSTFPVTGSDPTRNVTIGNRIYAVVISYCSGASAAYCTSNNIRAVHATTRLHGTVQHEIDTIFTQLR